MSGSDRSGFRSYEVYQRERVGETTNLVNARHLIADSYLSDPFTIPALLRENYPCYRDWVGNRFWITRYDDVTSVFADDANFETRSRLSVLASYQSDVIGRDLGDELWVRTAFADAAESLIGEIAEWAVESPRDLVAVASHVSQAWLGRALGLGEALATQVDTLVLAMQRGARVFDDSRFRGIAAYHELVSLLRDVPGLPNGLLASAQANDASQADIVVTLLERDLDTLSASLVNLWSLLLTHPNQSEHVVAEPRLMKAAYLEALRHSPPIITADRFARHEVERFGRLLPHGALLHLSAAAANRDPRQFAEPDRFDVNRKDLCQREPRGQFRADGLPAGIAFGHGKPSVAPAVPRDEPRSMYALTRDLAVAASLRLFEQYPGLKLRHPPVLGCAEWGAPYTATEVLVEAH